MTMCEQKETENYKRSAVLCIVGAISYNVRVEKPH